MVAVSYVMLIMQESDDTGEQGPSANKSGDVTKTAKLLRLFRLAKLLRLARIRNIIRKVHPV